MYRNETTKPRLEEYFGRSWTEPEFANWLYGVATSKVVINVVAVFLWFVQHVAA
jgi:hypothetical protein